VDAPFPYPSGIRDRRKKKRIEFKTGYSIKFKFSIAQPNRDEHLLRSLITYFDCGNLYKNRETFELVFANI
jgi:hypothetical protein